MSAALCRTRATESTKARNSTFPRGSDDPPASDVDMRMPNSAKFSVSVSVNGDEADREASPGKLAPERVDAGNDTPANEA